jgi:hypothetical protein
MIDPVIELTFRLGLALLFGAAAWHKVTHRARFGAALRAYGLLPHWSASLVSRLLPLVEAFIAVGLLHPLTRSAAAFAAISILVLYTAAIAANLLRGRREIDCGCFASSVRAPLSGWLLARNAIPIATAIVVAMPVRLRTLTWIDVMTTLMALITLSLLWAATQKLIQTAPTPLQWGGVR